MAFHTDIPTLMIEDHEENKGLDWRSATTPNNSRLEFFDEAFADRDRGALFPRSLDGPTKEASCTVSTLLDQQLGSISLLEQNGDIATYMDPILSPHPDGVDGANCKAEPGWPNDVFDRCYDGLITKSLTGPLGGRIYHHGHALYPIETSSYPFFDRPPSSISESTINSTPINSSCSEGSREISWPQVRQAPYPSPSQRKRSSSTCHQRNSRISGGPNRKRSSSDVYLSENLLETLNTPNDFNSRPPHMSEPVNINAHPSCTTSWDGQQGLSYQSSPGFTNSLSGAMGAEFYQPWAHGRLHNSGTRPAGVFREVSPPLTHSHSHSPNEDVNQSNSPHFRPQVASEAVMKAAMKKRKHPEGKMFPCDICGAELTTKQNLQYHISAHKGIREYTCNHCDRAFGTPHVRNRHQQKCRN